MRSPKHKKKQIIHIQKPHIQSRAAYIKLRRKLQRQDPTENYELNRGFRRKYLTERLEQDGMLICEYCGKHPLILKDQDLSKDVRENWLATLDHVKCKSRGGSRYDKNNIKIACPQCNGEKSNLTLGEFENIRNLEEA